MKPSEDPVGSELLRNKRSNGKGSDRILWLAEAASCCGPLVKLIEGRNPPNEGFVMFVSWTRPQAFQAGLHKNTDL